ncbi:Zn-dependent hydrolase [Caballeronia sp. GAWG2-1]|uniref:Zn-dependent hydrolase n=1 Tax=Caballeronia sp. GAWG2-1 TaxID=2921744 RepID=UPI002028AC94|nr:Zn-dependent hydrolase [Caballeronia sp. GAWG2-1]
MTSQSFMPEALGAGEPGTLAALLTRFAAFGGLKTGGVTRLCASAADGAARDAFATLLRDAGAHVVTDAVGNQFGVFTLTDAVDAPLVMMGSHLDSQPRGGRFDGVLGVLAAFEAGRRLMLARRAGASFNANFCAVNWTNEEGARFRPSLLGSGTFTGKIAVADALASIDDDGVTLAVALAAIGHDGVDAPPPVPACYVEMHVEQGGLLEAESVPVGVVTRNWGAAKMDVRFMGEQAHTGPAKMHARRDALFAASQLICDVRAIADEWPERIHTSVGRLVVQPNSPNVVPAQTDLSVELRAVDNAILREAEARILACIDAAAKRANVGVQILSRTSRPIRELPPAVGNLVRTCARAAGVQSRDIDTISGHDALSLLDVCPTGLMFVPSVGGIAHNENEETHGEDLDTGMTVLMGAAYRLCVSRGDPVAAAAWEPRR